MITFISAVLYLPQSREDFSAKWKLASRAPDMYEPYPRKRGIKSYLRRYMMGNDRPSDKLHLEASRRIYEDEKDATLKDKITTLVKQTVQDTEERMKEAEAIKIKYSGEQAYKAGFVLSMVKKSREVLNELFNVAIKHRDEWQTLEQLKIFEMIVNTNVDTNHLLKQLQDIQAGRETNVHASPGPPKPTDVTTTTTTQVTTISNHETTISNATESDAQYLKFL